MCFSLHCSYLVGRAAEICWRKSVRYVLYGTWLIVWSVLHRDFAPPPPHPGQLEPVTPHAGNLAIEADRAARDLIDWTVPCREDNTSMDISSSTDTANIDTQQQRDDATRMHGRIHRILPEN